MQESLRDPRKKPMITRTRSSPAAVSNMRLQNLELITLKDLAAIEGSVAKRLSVIESENVSSCGSVLEAEPEDVDDVFHLPVDPVVTAREKYERPPSEAWSDHYDSSKSDLSDKSQSKLLSGSPSLSEGSHHNGEELLKREKSPKSRASYSSRSRGASSPFAQSRSSSTDSRPWSGTSQVQRFTFTNVQPRQRESLSHGEASSSGAVASPQQGAARSDSASQYEGSGQSSRASIVTMSKKESEV